MQSVRVVEADDVLVNVGAGLQGIGIRRRQTRSILRFRKKRSMTALTLLCQEAWADPLKSAKRSG